MIKMLGILLIALTLLSVGVWAQPAVDLTHDELLATLDEVRFLDADVSTLRVRIDSTTPDETRQAELLLRFLETDGASFSRIEFLTPEELAGQVFLNTPEGTFFFGPELDFPIKTSATTEVFGDAAVAQTSGIRFLGSYDLVSRETMTSEDGAESWLELGLLAVDFSVAFQEITLRVDPETLQPISAVLYALSGLPIYEVFYEVYETREIAEGRSDVYVRTQRIENRFLVGRITVSEILEVSLDEHAFDLFDPDRLGDS